MKKKKMALNQIAYARSGDKGNSANIGIIAYTHEGYIFLRDFLSASVVHNYFFGLKPLTTTRYELDNLEALNFILEGALGGGGSLSLRTDSQGKALGQALLEMPIELTEDQLRNMRPK